MPDSSSDDGLDDGTRALSAADAPTGATPAWRVAGRYRVLGRIGAGGMADVMRAHDELLNRDVAVKIFRAPPPTPDTASGVDRQHAELNALARLNHPNLTMLFDGSIVGQDGPAYIVMELIEGPSLAQRIDGGGLPDAQAREVGAQIADALGYVHAAGMVHRDVKPANILLGGDSIVPTETGRARLTDFGIVRLVGSESLTQADMTLGSASYLAPEQARGSAVGPPADVYALGLSLIEALTGRRSFDGPPLEAVMARLANDPEIPPNLPEPWPALLTAMTARNPQRRPTAAQVAQALRAGDAAALGMGAVAAGPTPAATAAASSGYTEVLPRPAAATRPPVAGPPPPPMAPMPPVRRAPDRLPPEPYDPPPSRLTPWLIAAGIIAALLLTVGIVVLATSGGGGSGAPTTTPTAGTPSTRGSTTRSSSSSSEEPSSSTPSTDTNSQPSTQDTPTPTEDSPSRTKTKTSSAATSKPPSSASSSPPTSASASSASRTRTRTSSSANAEPAAPSASLSG